jgi:uncharacterized protein YdhG (YjbR/CyaY superfamily)
LWRVETVSKERDMEPRHTAPATVDEYIAARPAEVQSILRAIRAAIRSAAPEATERLSYGMPTFFLKRVLVHLGAFKNHIGLFPPVTDPALEGLILPYRGPKGNLRFPLDQPIPYALIGKIVTARVSAIGGK